ncbi:hypothetical protein [Microbacterium abyssi]|uniref:hypothetical protein n=1 Tax=Microbacterium abyssi TaxID=2782166 RepID=UPI00188869A3|nr:hypothetical protein [Microbacterium sp. A18JL241]
MSRRRTGPIVVAALGALMLAGCATASPAPEASTPAPEPSATSADPDPSPTSEPPVDLEDPSTWVVTETGIGPIETGGDFAATLAELPDTWMNDENCSWAAWWNAEDESYNMNFVRGTESEEEPIVLASASAADPVTPGVGPRTEEGLGIGSTKDEVRAQYPDAAEGEAPIGEGTWLSVPGDGTMIFFEYYTGDQANAVTVTTLEEPPYEVCG